MISCLMITGSSREAFVARSLASFSSQSVTDKELVIVHDGDAGFCGALESLRTEFNHLEIHLVRARPGLTLGELRNLSVESANGEYVCQWDDDDICHPDRLRLQYSHMQDRNCEFSFLGDQLHLYEKIGHLFWEDWRCDPPPGNWIHGTVMGRRDRFPAYPSQQRGEDTGVAMQVFFRDERVSTLSDLGYLYVYTYNGSNSWDLGHHLAISQRKRKNETELMPRLAELRTRLSEYAWQFSDLVLPFDNGTIRL